MKSTRLVWFGACAGLALSASAARADRIVWTEQFLATPSVVKASAVGSPRWPGTAGVRLTADPLPRRVTGSTDLVAAGLRTFLIGPPGTAYAFHTAPYSVTLMIRDVASGVFGAVTFTGVLNGTLARHSAHVSNTWTSPTAVALHLGHHVYDVSITSFSPPGIPGSRPGAIGVHVRVRDNPEPAAVVLAALAVPALVLAARRRRRASGVG
jgi:hypothetical protein